ncbi:hypothetical protein P2318_09705 [Myxococcaceae bacterium GXIMD 01537]
MGHWVPGAWLKGLCGGALLGALTVACGPIPERESPADEAGVEQGPEDGDAPVNAEWAPSRPLPPERFTALSGPSVAFGSGKFFVVWADEREGGVYGGRMKPDGTLLDPEGIRINIRDDDGGPPFVAYDGTNFVVVWHGRDGIFGVRVKPNGTVLGPVFTIINSDEVDAPAIACAPEKVCLVTFTSVGDIESTIFFARVKPDGTVIRSPVGTFLGSAETFANESSVAWDGKQFLVVWSDTIGGVDSPDIYGGRVTADGRIVGDSEGFAISDAPGAQRTPDVTWTGRRFLTVWADNREGEFRIFGARVRKDTTVDDPDGIPISTGLAFDPAVAHHNWKSLVVWGEGTSGAAPIVGAFVEEDGDVRDPSGFLIAGELDAQFLPDVAYGDNRFLTVYAGSSSRDARPFTIRGNRVKHDMAVSEPEAFTRSFEEPPVLR